MVASRFLFACLLSCLFLTAATAAEVRTWTDTSGKTLTGKFVEFVDGNKVRIDSNGKSYDISIDRFSNSDKEYLEEQKEEEASSSARPRRSNLKGWREWTDDQGTQIKAKYVRMFDGHVILLQGKTPHKVPFYKMSEEDQAYLRAELTALGEQDSIPPKPVEPVGNGEPGSSNPTMGGPAYTPPEITQPSNNNYEPTRLGNQTAAYEPPKTAAEIAAENQKIEEARRREAEKLAYANQKQLEHEAEEARRAKQKEREQQQVASNTRPPRFSGPSNSNFGPSQEVVDHYYCSSCNKTVSSNVKAGDRCPHCGIVFDYKEGDNGTKTYANNSSSSGSFRIRNIGKIIGGISALLGLLYAGFRKLVG
ncbi:hypothetical protein DTL42_03525 [Bremerella cremea]|uniref:SLA1 homology domain-containing protein n=1 Tax=Bremerella cremea TaxID=1031537 RepID=A0A368KUY0_9BACT|nr:SHD1 domain-containing protein [Bremerella cremea]RCS54230.1 hypothetical protein DTL42_03525 [Bremerella cremea]